MDISFTNIFFFNIEALIKYHAKIYIQVFAYGTFNFHKMPRRGETPTETNFFHFLLSSCLCNCWWRVSVRAALRPESMKVARNFRPTNLHRDNVEIPPIPRINKLEEGNERTNR